MHLAGREVVETQRDTSLFPRAQNGRQEKPISEVHCTLQLSNEASNQRPRLCCDHERPCQQEILSEMLNMNYQFHLPICSWSWWDVEAGTLGGVGFISQAPITSQCFHGNRKHSAPALYSLRNSLSLCAQPHLNSACCSVVISVCSL